MVAYESTGVIPARTCVVAYVNNAPVNDRRHRPHSYVKPPRNFHRHSDGSIPISPHLFVHGVCFDSVGEHVQHEI